MKVVLKNWRPDWKTLDMGMSLRSSLVIGLALCLGAAGCGNDKDNSVITIGYAAAITGELAPYDSPDGVQCAIDRINEDGGVLGRQINLLVKDMESDPVRAGEVAQQLLDAEVSLILGPPTDDTAIPIADLAQADGNGVAVLAVTATQPGYPIASPENGFMTAYGDNSSAAAVAEYLFGEGVRTAYLMFTSDIGSYGLVTPNAFGDALERLGGSVVGSDTWSYGVGDFGPQVTRIAALADEPDTVFFAGPVPDNASFIRQLRDAGVDSVVSGTDGFDDPAFLEVGGDDVNGTVFSTLGFPHAGGALLEFYEDCDKRGYNVRNVFTGMGGDAMQVVKAAIERAGSSEPRAILNAIRGLDTVEGIVTDSITYKGMGGTPLRNIAVVVVRDGQFVHAADVAPGYVPVPRTG